MDATGAGESEVRRSLGINACMHFGRLFGVSHEFSRIFIDEKKSVFIREICGLNFQKCRSGGRRAPATDPGLPIWPAPGLAAGAGPGGGDGDVYAQRPLRCSVYRDSHTPD